MTGTRRRRWTGRVAIGTAAVLAVAAGAAAAYGVDAGWWRGAGGRPAAASGLPPATAKVTRETLVDTETTSGQLGYGDTTTLTGRLAGTVTELPVAGSTVSRGKPLYRVDSDPVLLLYGKLPAYRPLAVGTEGRDVKQFEQNLYALGYRGFTVDEEYTADTAEAVEEWQDDLGLRTTGTVELGRVVYAPGAIRVDTHKVALGDAVGPGAAVLTYTGSARVVTVELEMADQRLARKGAAVTVTLPDGRTVPGKIAQVSTVIDPGDGDGGGPGDESESETKLEVTVTVADAKAFAKLDQAALKVGFTAATSENVLTVPVAALLALAEGGYGVEVVDGRTTRVVAVETGLFAGGRVEVSGDGIAEGTVVGVPS